MASPRPSATPRIRKGNGRAAEARQALYRNLVLEAAEQTFAEHSIDGSKMEQIAEAAGLSLGTVYAVFRGKAAIVDALHERRLREVLERAGVAARDLSDPLETLIAGVRAYVQFFLAHPDYLRMYIAEGAGWGLRGSIAARSARGSAWEEGIAMQARLFRRGMQSGVFHDGDPDRMARTMVAMQQVRLADWVDDEMADDPESLISEMELQLRRAFCRRAEDRTDGTVRRKGEQHGSGK
jgi:AcrR family transcriptional regulator